jgi:glycosyltransferase involved in cell wall biosynthesis
LRQDASPATVDRVATRVDSPRVSVVIPAMNEAENLPHVFARLPSHIAEIVLVDGNSVDGTVEIARELYPDVRIVGQLGRGKGDALLAGFSAATGDVIVAMDADGSTDPAELSSFVHALTNGADVAKGSRFVEGGGSADITLTRRVGNWVLCRLVNRFFGARYSDLCYGYFAFWADCLPILSVDCDGFEVETLIGIRAAKGRLNVVEVASFERSRIYGASHLRVVRDGTRIMRTILRERFQRNAPPRTPCGETIDGVYD